MTDDKGDKKHAIFKSTLALIREHGFHGAPMSLVAKNAGVAAGTIYHYFESKEQLICELYDYNRNRVLEVVEKSIDRKHSYKDNFFNIWTNLNRFYVQEPDVLTFFDQFVNSPFNADKYPKHFRGTFYDFLADGVKAGVIKAEKPELLLVLVMGSINATAKLHVSGRLPMTKSDLQRIAEMLWEGIASHSNKRQSKP